MPVETPLKIADYPSKNPSKSPIPLQKMRQEYRNKSEKILKSGRFQIGLFTSE